MPLKVGELYATMKLVTSDFDRALDTSGSKFQSFGNMLKSGTQLGAQLFAGATTAAVGLGTAAFKVGADYNRMQQTSRAALKSILGSTEAVNAQMDKLDEFAKNSPFSKQTFIQAQQQMLGFGVAAEDVIPALDAIQNGVAAMGGSNEDISSITYALSQMQSQGKLSGETLRDLGVYGIDAASIIADQMGVSGEEIRDMASKPGGIPVDQVWDPLINGLTERFGGATAEVKQQFDGALDRVKAAWRDTGSVLAQPWIDPNGGGQLVEWTNLFADGLRAIEKQAGPVVDIMMGRLAPTIDLVTGGLTEAKDVIAGWDSSRLESGLDKIGEYGPIVASTSAALFTMGTKNVPVLGALGTGMGPVIAGIAALVASSPQLRAVGADFLQALQPAIGPAGQLAQILADSLMRTLDRLTPSIGDTLEAGADLAVTFTSGLVPAAKLVTGVAEPLIGIVGDLASWFSQLPQPVQTAVAAIVLMHGKLGPLNSLLTVAGKGIKSFGETIAIAGMVAKQDGIGTLTKSLGGVSGVAKKAGSALLGAFGGPVGLAITAVVAGLTLFAQKSAEAQARADSYAAALQGVEGSAENTAAALTRVSNENIISGDNMDWGWVQKLNSGFDSTKDALDGVGISVSDFSAAINGSGADVENMEQRLDGIKEKYPELGGAVRELKIKLGQQAEASQQAQSGAEALEQANEDLADSAYLAADANRDHKLSLEELNNYRQGLTDKILAQKQAQRDLDEQIQRSGETIANAESTSRDYEQALDDVAKKTIAAMKASADNGDLEGMQQSLKDGKEAFIEFAQQAGMSADEAQAAWDELKISADNYEPIKPEVDITDAQATIEELGMIINDETGMIEIGADSVPAQTTLAELGLEIDEKDGTVTINGEKYPAETTLAQYLATVDGSVGDVKIDGNTYKGDAVLSAYLKAVSEGHEYVEIDGKKYKAESVLSALKGQIKGTTENVYIGADNSRAMAAIGQVKTGLSQLFDKTVHITTVHNVVGNGKTSNTAVADGGIINSYADGKLPDQALIKSPQSNLIQWAEPETEGEAFIPLAKSKRSRSIAIWREVGKRFGIESFATGGLTHSSWSAINQNLVGSLPAEVITKLVAAIVSATATANATSKTAAKTQKAEDAAKKAVDQANSALKSLKARKASQAQIDAAQRKLDAARDAQTKAVEKNRDAQTAAKDAAKDLESAEKDLTSQHDQLASAIRSTVDKLTDAYTDSYDAADLLANMGEGVANITEFKSLIDQLRTAGLSEDLVQQIISQGEVTGAETARSILEGGKPMITDLNAAAQALLEAATALGKTSIIGVKQYADGKFPTDALIQSPVAGLVQWAEPSTHGEALIPFAPSKRARSLQIWEEAGRRLGVVKMANGAVRSPMATASHPGDVFARISPDDMRTLSQMVAEATRQGTSEGISKRGRESSVSARMGGF